MMYSISKPLLPCPSDKWTQILNCPNLILGCPNGIRRKHTVNQFYLHKLVVICQICNATVQRLVDLENKISIHEIS